ncbi:MAG: hypothetical protein AB8G11_11655 [Saprospiraceae bacterium]
MGITFPNEDFTLKFQPISYDSFDPNTNNLEIRGSAMFADYPIDQLATNMLKSY